MTENQEVIKVLVMDDDRLVRRSVEKLLQREGYAVTSVEDGEQGVEVIKSHNFDLIISDIRMPNKNGVEAIREIRKVVMENMGKDIPIIFITGYAEMGQELDAEGLGEVIQKPFDLERLIMTVREYL